MPRFPAKLFASPGLAGLPVDLICLSVFVVMGRESHDLNGGATWFLTVWWPFALSWTAIALATHVYSRNAGALRPAVALIPTIALAMVLRVTVTHRSIAVAFVVVALAFNLIAFAAWRFALGLGLGVTRRS